MAYGLIALLVAEAFCVVLALWMKRAEKRSEMGPTISQIVGPEAEADHADPPSAYPLERAA